MIRRSLLQELQRGTRQAAGQKDTKLLPMRECFEVSRSAELHFRWKQMRWLAVVVPCARHCR